VGIVTAARDEARVAELKELLRQAADWIEEEDPYQDPHDEVRLNFISQIRRAIFPDPDPKEAQHERTNHREGR